MIQGREAEQLYKKYNMKHPGDCSHCRTRHRGGNTVHYKDGKIYCTHHEMDVSVNAELMTIPRSRP